MCQESNENVWNSRSDSELYFVNIQIVIYGNFLLSRNSYKLKTFVYIFSLAATILSDQQLSFIYTLV